MLAVLALVIASVIFTGTRNDDVGTGAPTTVAPTSTPTTPTTAAPTTAPPTTVDPGPALSQDEFLAVVKDLQAYVSEARGLPFIRDVNVELEDDAAFEARLLADFDDDAEDIAANEVFYKALGLIAPDADLVETLRAIYAAGVLGFYDSETDELVVRGTSASPYVRQTIVHELVHALDDQQFELFRPEYDDRDDEIGTGFSAVVEGNARRVEESWLAEQPADVRAQVAEEEEAFGAAIDYDAFPDILLFQLGAPYQLGQVFVDQLLRDQGERAVDAALVDPPDTSEQFLFYERYQTRDPRIEVPPPPADGAIVEDGVIGALFLFGMFTNAASTINEQDAVRAVEGWGGDWAVTWKEGDANCIRADFVGDTDGDTDELGAALEVFASDTGVGEVSTVDGRIRFESCVVGADPVPPQV